MSVALRRCLWDAGVPAALAAGTLLALYGNDPSSPRFEFRGSSAGNVALLLATCAPLVWRRRHPLAVCVAFLVAQAAWHVALYPSDVWDVGSSGPPPDTPILAGMVAFFSLGRRAELELRDGVALLVASLFLTQLALGAVGQGGTFGLGAYGWWIGALVVGRLLGRRERAIGVLGDRAARLEREREQEAARATLEERARIARELHDVIAHAVSVIVVQAQAGPHLVENPRRAIGVFHAIESSGRDALEELRRLLGILRSADEQLAIGPQPGLGSLQSLIEQVRASGLPVELRIEGEPVHLPAGIDLSAYRIVQEALTNVVKHTEDAAAEVVIRYGEHALELDVVDDGHGRATSANGAGHGLIGMRERVALYGGALEAGTRDDGGYAVCARIPLESAT
jgi:signal transduction histidine kinase